MANVDPRPDLPASASPSLSDCGPSRVWTFVSWGKVPFLRSAFEDNSDIETNTSREALTFVPAAPQLRTVSCINKPIVLPPNVLLLLPELTALSQCCGGEARLFLATLNGNALVD